MWALPPAEAVAVAGGWLRDPEAVARIRDSPVAVRLAGPGGPR
jgi:hypothetical protein